jgi:hypothetical protein
MSRTANPSSRRSTAPAPDPAPFADPAVPPDDTGDPSPAQPAPGRDGGGRFTKGNKGGPGNPFGRQTAAFRTQLLEAVTKEDMAAICTTLIWRARAGSVPHVKLLFSYIIGKPTEPVNPDTLDRQEMDQYRQEIGMEDLACKVGQAMTPEMACTIVQTVRPVIMERVCDAIVDQLLEGVPPEYLQPDGQPGTDPEGEPTPPSANRENGEADGGKEPSAEAEPENKAPLTNGANGAEARPAAGAAASAGNGSKRPRETGSANATEPQPRRAPPWPGGCRPAAAPEARGPALDPAGRPRGSGNVGGPPPIS